MKCRLGTFVIVVSSLLGLAAFCQAQILYHNFFKPSTRLEGEIPAQELGLKLPNALNDWTLLWKSLVAVPRLLLVPRTDIILENLTLRHKHLASKGSRFREWLLREEETLMDWATECFSHCLHRSTSGPPRDCLEILH